MAFTQATISRLAYLRILIISHYAVALVLVSALIFIGMSSPTKAQTPDRAQASEQVPTPRGEAQREMERDPYQFDPRTATQELRDISDRLAGDAAAPTTQAVATQAAARRSGSWSDLGTWPSGTPEAGDDVTIPAGQTVRLDEDTPPLGHLRVEGTLRFDDARDLALTADWIWVEGRLEVGTEADPFEHEAVITLTGDSDDTLERVGGKFFVVAPGAELELHGAARAKTSWTQLGATARPGDTQISLTERPDQWAAGDEIIIAPTSIDPHQAEQVTIASISGQSVSFEQPLEYRHWGELQTFGTDPARTLDQRAEVGMLTRNIRIQGDEASTDDGYGGHLMVSPGGAEARIEGVEFYRMGQKGRLARYPLHWHLNGDVEDEYAKANSIHHGYNRCITVHGTNDHVLEGNVGYRNLGHCFFLEDGTETGNLVKDNLAMDVLRSDEAVLETDRFPAGFWTSNPNNRFIGNTSAGTENGFGFWFGLSDFSNAPNEATDVAWGAFRGNTTHSNSSNFPQSRDFRGGGMGLFVDQHSAEARALVEDFTSYKNQRVGVWAGNGFHLEGVTLADNRLSAFGLNMLVEDALIVGRSATLTEEELRQLRRTEGVKLYDGYMSLKDATAANFTGERGVIAWRNVKSSSNNYPPSFIENVEFVNAKPVYLESHYDDEKEPYRTYALRDRDGSITGEPGYVTYNAPIQLTENCTVHGEWRAAFCPDPNYFVPVHMNIGEKSDYKKDFEFVRRSDGAVGHNSTQSAKLPGGQAYEVRLTSDAIRGSYRQAHEHNAEIWSIDRAHWVELDLPWKRSAAFLYAKKGSFSENNTDLRARNDRYPSVAGATALAESDATSYYVDEEAQQLRVKVFANNEDGFARYAHQPSANRTVLRWCDRMRCREPEVGGDAPPAYAGEGAGLTGKYFVADDFTALRATRNDRNVAFDWNEGAALDLPAGDDFSARWTGQVEAPASERYTFTITHGEDVRLWIDGEQVIDAWDSSRFLNTSSGTISLEAGQRYDLRMEYRGGSHEAAAQLEWAYAGYASHTVPTAQLFPSEEVPSDEVNEEPESSSPTLRAAADPGDVQNGLDYAYYEDDFSTALPDFTALAPQEEGTTPRLDLGAARSRENDFAYRFEGYVEVPEDGTYTFYTESDDGSQLYIGDERVVDNDGEHGAEEERGEIGLKAGMHPMTVAYYENEGGQVLSVRYAGPGQEKQELPASALYRDRPGAAPQPYGETPAAVPGLIEAEAFDRGGEGIGYHDIDPANQASSTYRAGEGVDADAEAVKWIREGEWIAYTVNVAEAGTYALEAEVATRAAGNSFHLEVDGADVSDPIALPNTGGWSAYQTTRAGNVALEAGKQVLRIATSTGYFNLDGLRFTRVDDSRRGEGSDAEDGPGVVLRDFAIGFIDGGQALRMQWTTTRETGDVKHFAVERATENGSDGRPRFQEVATLIAEGAEPEAEVEGQYTFTSRELPRGSEVLMYRLRTVDASGQLSQPLSKSVQSLQAPPAAPQEFALRTSAPNPFRERTTVYYRLPEAARVDLSAYDALGRKVRTLVKEEQGVGSKEAVFEARALPSGVYLLRLVTESKSGTTTHTQKVVLVR